MLAADASLPDWLSWLETLSPHEIDLGLERVHTVLAGMQLEVPADVLIIGGTNGKGSSVAMGEALLRASGKRPGAYTSPHVLRYNERIRIDGREASDDEILAAFRRVEAARNGLQLTYFEYGTLAAFAVFAEAGLDVWVLEVGLGGRLDATNVVDPSAVLITNVSLDHCDWLGDNVERIAAEKAGIMRPGTPVVFGATDVPEAIRHHARDIGAQLILPTFRDDLPNPGLAGSFQKRNASNVLALLEAAGLNEATTPELIQAVLPSITLRGRSERIRDQGVEWLLDVAHNPAAAEMLAQTLAESPVIGRTIAIVGILDDKDVAGIVGPIASQVDQWVAITAASPRAIPVDELARKIANHCDKACLIAAELDEAVEFARRVAAGNDRILVTGSFFTVGPVIKNIGLDVWAEE